MRNSCSYSLSRFYLWINFGEFPREVYCRISHRRSAIRSGLVFAFHAISRHKSKFCAKNCSVGTPRKMLELLKFMNSVLWVLWLRYFVGVTFMMIYHKNIYHLTYLLILLIYVTNIRNVEVYEDECKYICYGLTLKLLDGFWLKNILFYTLWETYS